MSGLIVLQLILVKISDDGETELALQEIYDNLSLLPIATFDYNTIQTLISCLLKQCYDAQNRSALRLIVNYFDEITRTVLPLPILVDNFVNAQISSEVLEYCVKCVPEKTPIDYFVDLINSSDDAQAVRIASLLTTILPNLTLEDWTTLLTATDDVEEEIYRNPGLRAFFKGKVAEGQTVPVPVWIKSLPVSKLPTPPDLPSVSEAVKLIMNDMVDRKLEVPPNLKDLLISQYSISTIPEKIDLLSSAKKLPVFDDTLIFQEYGPFNTIYSIVGMDYEKNSPCARGCRMLTCTEFETLNTQGDEVDFGSIEEHLQFGDWFRGSCDKCSKRIVKRHYSYRRPLNHGGWQGCYCSFDCAKLDITNANELMMAHRAHEQLKSIGIRDR